MTAQDRMLPSFGPADLGEIIRLQCSGLFDRTWFLDRNPDLLKADIDALAHFHRWGWRERRWPNAYFDPGWYIARNRDVQDSGKDPLLHYAECGEAEGRQPVPHFDPGWYRIRYGVPADMLCLAHFLAHRRGGGVSPVPEFDPAFYLRNRPDVAAAGIDPFEHYLTQGAADGLAPSAIFDTRFYGSRYLRDLPDINPLLHYRQHRHEPGVYPMPPPHETSIPQEVRRNTQAGPLFEEAEPIDPAAPRRAKLLAFYLPQFHPVPENDGWWGKGFTEWTNVGRGMPRFAGHYQPRLPRDLGYYRLDDPAVLARQIALARSAGLHGFVFYFYWFNGKRLLDAPLEALLADPALEMPFCLMWANENWTRRWDGSDDDVLISQDYRDADEPGLIAAFARHFDDPRYIRLAGRPVLMVYRAGLIPQTAAAMARWRRAFAAHGHDPVLVMAQSFGERDPRPFGMDAAVEFPPHKLTEGLPRIGSRLQMLDHAATVAVYDYAEVAAATELAPSAYPLIRTALPGWDNDARRQGDGLALHGSTPALYQAWLDRLIVAAMAQPVLGEPVVCINAWNEWAEGAYLEPDLHFGAAYLNATARAVGAGTEAPARARLLLVGHDAFRAGAQLLLLNLGRALRASGVDVMFLLLGDGALLPDYRAVAATSLVTEPAEMARFAQPLRARGFTTAIVNTAAAAAACTRLAEAGLSCTLLVHELPRFLRGRGLIDGVRTAVETARHVVFATSYVLDRFHELVAVPPGRAVILQQGLYRPVEAAPCRADLDLPPGAILMVGIGYADLRKGFDLFLHAWRSVHASRPDVHLLWVGDIDPAIHAYLAPEMAAAQSTGTFHHRPWAADGADWLAAADVHLLTSREDALPSVVLEAMSAGVPTVAFEDAGGTPELLRDHRAGVAVPLGDVAAMVAQSLALATSRDEASRARLAQAARQCFDFAAYADRLLFLACPALSAVTAIVPNYNYARYLPGRLRSIFAQTRPPADIVVLDDGSTDDSAAVVRVEAARAGRPVRWIGDPHGGQVFRQWRRAAAMAQTEFVWIAEADDEAEPDLLDALCRALHAAPDAVFGFADSRAVDAAGHTLWRDHQAYYASAGAGLLAHDGVFPSGLFLREALGARNLVLNASGVLWRRSALAAALDRCGEALDTFRLAGDWRLYAEALANGGSVAFVARPLNVHRRHAASVTHSMPVARHVQEVRRMQRHMRAVLGDDAVLRRDQRRALAEIRGSMAAGGSAVLRAKVDDAPGLA